jgi:hypothetical protein
MEGAMTDYWTVVREPQADESPFVGPFPSLEDAEAWADEQRAQGRKIHEIRKMGMPLGPSA